MNENNKASIWAFFSSNMNIWIYDITRRQATYCATNGYLRSVNKTAQITTDSSKYVYQKKCHLTICPTYSRSKYKQRPTTKGYM